MLSWCHEMTLSPTRSYHIRKPLACRGTSFLGSLLPFFVIVTVLTTTPLRATATEEGCDEYPCTAMCVGKGFDDGRCSSEPDYRDMCRCGYVLGRAPREPPSEAE
ncbi:hypothetical protein HPB52_002738 [Rhipicephalus sanguineus]|uniref:Defensin n=1 Tax=Rhipicephalus sanguineus TaxID=34632 RepID=A0A9D4PHS6_RHISA|nr:hypothetical protein HPB52_002738 [Rhipicephalus sanguineus]